MIMFNFVSQGFTLTEMTDYHVPTERDQWVVFILVDETNHQYIAICDNSIFVYNYAKRIVTHRLANRHKNRMTW